MNPKTIQTLLTGLLFLAPAASAMHADPTHGVAPHSVGDSPLDIHPVAISTPHPYPMGETFTYEIAVEDADSLSVHFERYQVNGWFSTWLNTCSGSEVRILDGNTGLELESFCGTPEGNDFWTADYPTNSLIIEFVTSGWASNYYGFDIYEVAANGASPIASVPYSEDAGASATPSVNVNTDPFSPDATTANANLYVNTDGFVDANANGQYHYGTFYECTWLSCEEYEGFKGTQSASYEVGGESLDVSFMLVGRADDSPAGYSLDDPVVECEYNGEAC